MAEEKMQLQLGDGVTAWLCDKCNAVHFRVMNPDGSLAVEGALHPQDAMQWGATLVGCALQSMQPVEMAMAEAEGQTKN